MSKATSRLRQAARPLRGSGRSLAVLDPRGRRGSAGRGLLRVDLRAERLDWVPAVLASFDRPFVIERPDELRGLVVALSRLHQLLVAGQPPPARRAVPARSGCVTGRVASRSRTSPL